jgi:hypothetical protein
MGGMNPFLPRSRGFALVTVVIVPLEAAWP